MLAQLKGVTQWDLCVIGGGATGLGIAVDAASRGLKTILLEKKDFASGTSSRSTKLVHGGVRYLQQGNIRMVMEGLKERGLLLKNSPNLVKNLAFVIPQYKWWEKPWYGIGLKIYDKMAGSLGLGPSVILSRDETLQHIPTIDPENLKGGILYHDGQFDDARLAIALAKTAAHHGSTLLNYFSVNAFLKQQEKIIGVWVRDQFTGADYEVFSKVVINATGVFADRLLQMDGEKETILRASQGIHLTVNKSFLPGNSAIMIPRTDDGRVLFAVPWHDHVILGTTDTAVNQITDEPVAFEQEIEFVLRNAGKYLRDQPARKDVKSMFAGLRPLVKGNAKTTASLSRDHTIIQGRSGLITITGGKWTTYRKMSQDVVDKAIDHADLKANACITTTLPLHDEQLTPSGDRLHPFFPVTSAMIREAVQKEMCVTLEDALSRRTRILLLDAAIAKQLAPTVADIMASELGWDEQRKTREVDNFYKLADQYLPKLTA